MATTTREAQGFDGYLSLSEDGNTEYFRFGNLGKIAVQIDLDSTNAVGTIYPEVSNTKEKWVGTAFVDGTGAIDIDGYGVTSGDDSTLMFDLESSAAWFRLRFDYTSGAGSANVFINRK